MNEVYDFPMSVEEAIFIHDCLLELKKTYYIGSGIHFTVEKKHILDSLLDNLDTWIDNREI